jgi:hypothetical protein
MFCAISTLALIWTRVIIAMFLQAEGLKDLEGAPLASVLLAPPVIMGWLSMATLWAAMWYFWLSFDKNSFAKKSAWFLGLMLPPLGTLAYFFTVYWKSTNFRAIQCRDRSTLNSSEQHPLPGGREPQY